MATYFITFAPRYRVQEHPILPDIDPDGYVTLEASTYQEALKKAHLAIGAYYDGICSERYFDETRYPLGKLGSL